MHWKRTLLLLVGAAIGAAVLAFYWDVVDTEAPQAVEAETAKPTAMEEPFVTFVDPAKGPRDALVTIVEFGDHACPHCRTAQRDVERLLAEHPAEIRFVWKSAPSPLHPGADTAAEAALCAMRQGRFWEFHEALFDEGGPFEQASLAVMASRLDLDTVAFGDCLTAHESRPLVERTVTEAQALGLTGVPTFFVNGVRFEGAMSYEELLQAAGL